MLAKRVSRIGLSPTLRISGAAKALAADGVDVVDLSIGEPDFPTPEHVKQAARQALADNLTGYTANEGIIALRRAICRKLARDNNLSYEPDQVLVSPGAKFCIFLAATALLEEGQDVVIPAPYWVSYPEQVQLAQANPVIVPTREEDGFRLTPERLASVLTFNTKLLVLNYPSNPCGATYTREQLAALAEVCEREGIWILADEIYEKLTYDGHGHVSIASISPTIAKRTMLVNGFSKAYSMTGWRVGYAAGPREVIQAMAKVQSHATSNANTIAQHACVAALEGPQGDVARMSAEFVRRRNYAIYRLRALEGISCDEPRGAFYLFPNVASTFELQVDGCPIRNSYGLAYYLLKHAHVAVVPGDVFGSPEHIRISYSTSMERLEEGMERISAALRRLERPRSARRLTLDNVRTAVDREVAARQLESTTALEPLVREADAALRDDEYREWNASIGGVVVQLRSNSPHLYQFWLENWYPAPQEAELEPHAVIYAVKGLAGRQPAASFHPASRTGFVVNTAHYGQLRTMALTVVAEQLERGSGAHLVRAGAVDHDGRGLLLMGPPGSGMSAQLWALLREEGVRLVTSDALLVRAGRGGAMADALERKLYLKTKWVRHDPRLAALFDRSPLENAVTSAHSNERCDGGESCPVTRGQGVCYQASNESRALLDPYWLGGTRRHVKRTVPRVLAIFRRDPVGAELAPLSVDAALAALEHATAKGPDGPTTAPWLNAALLDRSAGRADAQREAFRRLLGDTEVLAVNTAYADARRLTRALLERLQRAER